MEIRGAIWCGPGILVVRACAFCIISRCGGVIVKTSQLASHGIKGIGHYHLGARCRGSRSTTGTGRCSWLEVGRIGFLCTERIMMMIRTRHGPVWLTKGGRGNFFTTPPGMKRRSHKGFVCVQGRGLRMFIWGNAEDRRDTGRTGICHERRKGRTSYAIVLLGPSFSSCL